MKRLSLAVLVSACLFSLGTMSSSALGAPADTQLVKRLNPNSASSDPVPLAQFGGELFFFANDGTDGNELWKTDGSDVGTVLVKDINPGRGDAHDINGGAESAVAGGKLYFIADDGSAPELWVTDGTSGGTVPVTSFGNQGNPPRTLTTVGNDVLFFATSPGTGTELWKTNGTAPATLVKDINPGGSGSDPAFRTAVVGGTLFFTANDSSGSAIYRSDGTEAGTVMAVDTSSDAGALTAVGNELFWIENNNILYKGTSTATATVAYSAPGKIIQQIVVLGSRLYFNLAGGKELRSVGTSGADTVVTMPDSVSGLAAGAGKVFFTQYNNGQPRLWVSDGTDAGTKDVDPRPLGGEGISPDSQFGTSSTLYFTGIEPGIGLEAYVSDGTATHLLKDIAPGGGFANPRGYIESGGEVYFSADDLVHGRELWKTDGTEAGTVLVKDINTAGAGSSPTNLTDLGGTLYFGSDSLGGLFESDGTSDGTTSVDMGDGRGPANLVAAGQNLFFSAYADATGTELWKRAAAGGPAELVKDIDANGTDGSNPQDLTAVGDKVFFTADDGGGNALWVSDGTDAGTKPVPVAGADSIGELTAFDGQLFFSVQGTNRKELWKTDGDTTTKVFSFDLSSQQEEPRELTVAGDALYLFAFDSGEPHLWKSNGTEAGTSIVAPDLQFQGPPQHLTAAGGRVFFEARRDDGVEMWTSDGTDAGTQQVKDINPNGDSLVDYPPTSAAAVGDVLYFVADDGQHGFELWRSDGTEAGTTLVKDTGSDDGDVTQPRHLYAYQGVVYFLAGNTVWTSDGTTAGTRPATGPQFLPEPGIGVVDTGDFVGSGNAVFFAGNDGSSGRELWRITPPTADPVGPTGPSGPSGGTGPIDSTGPGAPVGNTGPTGSTGPIGDPGPPPNPLPGITDKKVLDALKKLGNVSVTDKQVTFTQQFVSTGAVEWSLEMTVAGKASAAGKVVIGTAKKTIKRTGRPKVTIKLNKRGRKHLRSMRKGKLTIVTHFKRKGAKKTLKATKTVKVKIKHGK